VTLRLEVVDRIQAEPSGKRPIIIARERDPADA
jgi:hypothetical protein